ncbi:MAG: hypothetical protein EOM21_20965, partial [Gammaproteobacteria bacterium]|nr:hypothetical protein [Gammaproteobacteria bacterium]
MMTDHPTFSQVLSSIGYDDATCATFEDVVLPFALMPHQLQGLHYALYYKRAGLFFEPRTGKTIVMQLLAIFNARFGVRTIQMMPPGLFRQFSGDYARIQGHGLTMHILDQTPARREKLLTGWLKEESARPDVIFLSQPIFRQHWQELYLNGFR